MRPKRLRHWKKRTYRSVARHIRSSQVHLVLPHSKERCEWCALFGRSALSPPSDWLAQYEKGERLDARHTHEDRPRERPPQRLGRLRHGLASDQYVRPHSDARSRAYLDAPSAMVRSNKWLVSFIASSCLSSTGGRPHRSSISVVDLVATGIAADLTFCAKVVPTDGAHVAASASEL